MKNFMLMIPFIALGAMGFTANVNVTAYSTASGSAVHTVQMQNDPLMAATNKMMKEMHAQPMKGNADFDFATMLRTHHQGAIDMAKVEVQQGKDAAMKQMAQKIIDAQTKEVAQLDQLIPTLQSGAKNYDPANKTSGAGKAMNDGMMSMMKMGNMSMSSIDHEFADMMSKHHKDGILMSKSILVYCKNQQLKEMAQKAIPEQTSDIKQMAQWMKSHK